MFRLREFLPGSALTRAQLDKMAELLTPETMKHPFILSVGGDAAHDAHEWYVFFRDPFDEREGKRNVYQWIKAPNTDVARLLLDHAPRPARNEEGSQNNG